MVAVAVTGSVLIGPVAHRASAQENVQRYVRYSHEGSTAYGVVRGDIVQQLSGPPYDSPSATGVEVALADITLLAPAAPSKVIAVGLNYLSHLGSIPPSEYPGLFAKLPTSIVGPDAAIEIPPDAHNVHYEGELVVVIGKMARGVSPEEARDYIFGVTAGNDISERDWQSDDLQWFRAKAADTFGPIGPATVTGLDYNDLHIQTRVNGELRQSESSSDLLFGIDEIVSYVSRYVTLLPGDLIFTGTPGRTQAMQPGDIVEIEVAGVGVLRNTVVRKGR